MWLTGRLAPDFKTIANFRQTNGAAIRSVCSHFIVLCRQLGLFTRAPVAIDGSKMKAVNNRDKNDTAAKVASRMKQVQDDIDRYFDALDRTNAIEALTSKLRRAVRQGASLQRRGCHQAALSDLEPVRERVENATTGVVHGQGTVRRHLRRAVYQGHGGAMFNSPARTRNS
jgi:hypothetical protein